MLERLCAPESCLGGAGLSKQDIQKLKEHGIFNVDTIAFTPQRKLLEVKGIGE